MNYNNYKPEDFAADESFISYYHKSDPIHVSFWESWMDDHPEKIKDVHQAFILIEVLAGKDSDVNFQLNLQKLKTYIDFENISLDQMPKIQPNGYQPHRAFNWLYFSKIAATVIVLISVGLGIYRYHSKNEVNKIRNYSAVDIAPGGNKATLTLTDGRQINLTEARNGVLADLSGIKVTKTAEGMIVYTVDDKSQKSAISPEYNTIETPKGGQYQVNLPDGTKVWLNAASSIRYPTIFIGKERKVEISGEAYFEVAKNAKMPFKVAVNNRSEVEVLGTHFNINSYSDEAIVKTTLLEGSVRVSTLNKANKPQMSVTLKPGQQSLLNKNDGEIAIKPADVEEVVAWKNGDFIFRKQPLTEILKTLSRWYSIDVEYETDSLSQQTYSGVISRSKNLSAVISMLESTGQIELKVEGNKIKVKK